VGKLEIVDRKDGFRLGGRNDVKFKNMSKIMRTRWIRISFQLLALSFKLVFSGSEAGGLEEASGRSGECGSIKW